MFKSIFRKKKVKVSEASFDNLTSKLLDTNSKLAEQLKMTTK
jgi:hypothetical protein